VKTLRALLRALAFMRLNRDETLQNSMAWLGLDRDLAERSYDAMLPNYAFDGSMDRDQFGKYVDMIANRRAAWQKNFSLADVSDFSFVEQASRDLAVK
jgi:hypothetical protein